MRKTVGPDTGAVTLDETQLPSIQTALIAWYAANARDLPWRRTRDPYAVLVSEIMLQQIQVSRAIPFYLAFLARFPTIQSLAEASIADVIHVWGDLGRYRRITNLHATARRIVADFGGEIPSDVAILRSLPGIGPYTAGAVACFAFERDVSFLDTNARRAIHRVFVGCDVPTAVSQTVLSALAGRVVPPGRGWVWNQAIIELGALVCTARRPRCASCPLQDCCAARGTIADALAASPRPPRVGSTAALAGTNREYRGKVLASLRANSDGVDLRALGRSLRAEFSDDDLPWISGVVDSLRRDGLAMIAEDRPTYSVDGSAPAGNDDSPWVRLPD
jgi:A/G-specific adenine glycosylase